MSREIATQTISVDIPSSEQISERENIETTSNQDINDVDTNEEEFQHIGGESEESQSDVSLDNESSSEVVTFPTASTLSKKLEDNVGLTLPPLAIERLNILTNNSKQFSKTEIVTTQRACRKYIGPQFPPSVSNSIITGFFYPKLSHATFGYNTLRQSQLVEDGLQLPILVSKQLSFYNRKGEKIRNLQAIDMSTGGHSKFKSVLKLKTFESNLRYEMNGQPLTSSAAPSSIKSKWASRLSPEKNFFKTLAPLDMLHNSNDSTYNEQGCFKIQSWNLEKRKKLKQSHKQQQQQQQMHRSQTFDFDATVSPNQRSYHLSRRFSNDV